MTGSSTNSMTKKLDEKSISNELAGASKFFEAAGDRTRHRRPPRKANERTVQPNGITDRSNRSTQLAGTLDEPTISTELTEGVADSSGRATERYAFEVYTDQRRRITNVQARYQIKTGRKLSASRIIREALDIYLKQLEVQLGER